LNNERLNILLVEDDAEDILLVKKILEKAGTGLVRLECADQLQDALDRLQKGKVDLVLLDLFLPDNDGLDSLRRVREVAPNIPIVILTALDDESAALEALSNGAQDYLVKGELSSSFFMRTIRHAIERQRIRIELDETNIRLEQLALVDPLTGLLNRRGLQQILSGQIHRAGVGSDLLALLIDLDDFKAVNDTLGHAVGDVVLNEMTRRLRSSLRATDFAARIGGDEFVILLPETRMAEGIRVAEKVRLAIAGSPVVLSSEKPVRVTASLGLVVVAANISSIDELLIATHAALAKSKKAGKNRVSYDIKPNLPDILEHDLRNMHNQLLKSPFRALRHSIYNLHDLKKVGYEFLSRSTLKHFEMPDDFFRVSLENNILTLVDHQCLKTCVSAAVRFLQPGTRCHLNLFPSTMIDIPIEHLIKELHASKPVNVTFCVEISEQQIIGDPSYLVRPVEELKKAGILVAIDDVGFGRSCFESLILLEPDILKIDKGCITGVAKDKGRIRSLKRILNVAHVLESEVIAEGIESQEDLDALRDLGVKFGQGFFLDKPVECHELVPA
jgi:diguanylate cyclase (GGDEF)-like protein